MRKSLFAIGLLAISWSVQAQILCHVDTNANMYVSKGTLVYSGGGMQMKGDGKIENHGNVMVVGNATDAFRTIDASNVAKTEANGGGNFVNMLNEPTAYASVNANNPTTPPVYTYGQLYVSGLTQANITGIIDQQFRQVRHGDYQQVGMPFYLKSPSTLNAELGKSFNGTRRSKNDMLHWDNTRVEFHHLPTLYGIYKFGNAAPAYAYWILGGNSLDVSNVTRTVKGTPWSDIGMNVTLQNAGSAINFGAGGSNKNDYAERYNTYLQDGFELTSGTAWTGNFGKNWYQYANPFLTNLDLSRIAYNEPATVGDGVNLSNIYGVRLDVSGVQYNQNGGGSGSYRAITFNAGVPTGDVDYMMIRPLGTFAIKLNNNSNADVLNFSNLRRFNYYSRDASTNYSVSANKGLISNSGTVKQLGVIALDANGKAIGTTYYVVYPNGSTGHTATATTQYAATGTDILGTFEESTSGGYDNNYTAKYWLYINEANENDFQGKNVKLVNYSSAIKSYKFEIRENAALVSDGTHQLSSGIGFYYKAPNGSVTEAKQGDVIPVAGAEYDLYYGSPSTLIATAKAAGGEVSVKPSRTKVVYNPEITNYIVRFDPDWKKADIEVYDMSGKLVISKKAVSTSTDFVIELDSAIKNSYVVKIVSDKGETVNTKILK
ncbi:T9SS type A sorting domain-containing protein [Chryseobacterium populi]|uniref:Por secretion system C-terminal sorting domain containing protein n=1 Tax=Chryseobacterium populi TaxID=1144316 RepID=J2K412_9FLAO|nr:T9SS type A sorting domain-containing protein [Chryseobacterium populi]EJL67983.1 Por secretion system C-terminal sorting domain containing protein [Chryseobacterium populi]